MPQTEQLTLSLLLQRDAEPRSLLVQVCGNRGRMGTRKFGLCHF